MNKDTIYILVSTTLVVISFFLGYGYAYRSIILESVDTNSYIDISTSTRNITIKNAPENIYFRVNGELIQTGSIDLK